MAAHDHMTVPLFAERRIDYDRRHDGTIIFRNTLGPAHQWPTFVHAVRHWVETIPDAPMIGEWVEGELETFTYRDIWEMSGVYGASLGDRVDPDRPLMILAPNGVRHAALALGAMRARVPVVPVSLAYALPGADPLRLRTLIDVASPGLLCAAPGLDLNTLKIAAEGVVVDQDLLASVPYGQRADPEWAESTSPSSGDIAKLIFTSGSTGTPKAVVNTHEMLCSNQAALAAIWPRAGLRPQVLLDWLPWSHTFGGNFTYNFAVMRGGAYLIDPGKPVAGQIEPTLAALGEVEPTAYFNVPAGYEALIPRLEADEALAKRFLGGLDFLFSAAAAMPQSLRDRVDTLARRVLGRPVPIIGGWGATETAPCSTATWFETDSALDIGAPLPGVAIKLAPLQGKLELRVKGPNVMPGYWRAPDAASFDDEGYLRMGDAARLVDDDDPGKGIIFDGRLAENFKLASGTWVNVGAVRQAVVEACAPLVQNVALTGHDGAGLGLIVFVHAAACSALVGEPLDIAGAAAHPLVLETIGNALTRYNRAWPASSTSIRQFLVEATAPAPGTEMTDKGYLNQRGVLAARAAVVARLDRGEGLPVVR